VASVSGGPFTILSGTPFSLAGFGTTNVVIQFAPGAAGGFTNSVTFTTSNGGNSTNPVTGTGAEMPGASFVGSPLSGVEPLAVVFTDNSTGTITNRHWDFGDGAISNTTSTVVGHTYGVAGTNTVVLTVSGPVGTNSLSRTAYIAVTNPPAQLSVSPGSLGFGPVIIGQTNSMTFQVVNNGGQTLNGTAATVAPFSISAGSPYSIAPSGTGLVTVAFSPTSAVNYSNGVSFSSNGGNSTNSVTGSGLTPAQLGVSPASLNFGVTAVGSNALGNFVVTNTGGAALSNGVASVSGGPFTILSGTPFSLAGFGTTNVVIQFAPGAAGGFTNSVTFTTSNGGNSTNPVTGTGAVMPGASFVGSPLSGVEPLAVVFTDNSTGTITNRHWDFGDGAISNTTSTVVGHTYGVAGTNTVVLTVSGPVGTNSLSRTAYIVVISPGPVTLTIELIGNQVRLTWPSGTLQSATQATGPYSEITGATSPYDLPSSGSAQFFRVKVQ
jgi:PKD repeat protein